MTTFQDHAARYERCAGPPSVPADGRRRFVAWRAAAGTALGNALNILAHACAAPRDTRASLRLALCSPARARVRARARARALDLVRVLVAL